jgi:hypothetical protein
MKIDAVVFRLPKAGNTAEEYEDAAYPKKTVRGTFNTFRLAVADGATEASFSGLWAEILVNAYRSNAAGNEGFEDRLPRLQSLWEERISKKPLPWYAEQKLQSGAFAALIGLTLSGGKSSGNWNALAVGDCCLFHVREEQLLESFPLSKSEEFNSRPVLISTNPQYNKNLASSIGQRSGNWQSNDRFYLMSDALACWFLSRFALPTYDPFDSIEAIHSQEDFVAFIALQREDKQLKNDDVTLIRCRLGGS